MTENGRGQRQLDPEEARTRLDRRLQTLQSDRDTAVRFIQMNLVILSLIGAGVSLGNGGIGIDDLVNPLTVLGGCALVGSTVLAVVAVSEFAQSRKELLVALASEGERGDGEEVGGGYADALNIAETHVDRSAHRVGAIAVVATWSLPSAGFGVVLPLLAAADGCSSGTLGLPDCGTFPGADEFWMASFIAFVFAIHGVGTVWHYRASVGRLSSHLREATVAAMPSLLHGVREEPDDE